MHIQGAVATFTARDFSGDVVAGKRSALTEPVIITDRGRPSRVLLSIEQYQQLVGDQRNIVQSLSTDDAVEVAPERLVLLLQQPDL